MTFIKIRPTPDPVQIKAFANIRRAVTDIDPVRERERERGEGGRGRQFEEEWSTNINAQLPNVCVTKC